jgi:hypothetical protein
VKCRRCVYKGDRLHSAFRQGFAHSRAMEIGWTLLSDGLPRELAHRPVSQCQRQDYVEHLLSVETMNESQSDDMNQ